MSTNTRLTGLLLAALLICGSASAFAQAQEPASVSLARQLSASLETLKLDSFAAKDGDGYVAALYYPGMLMVVSAKYSVPVLINEKLTKKEYKDIYTDLNGAPVAGTKFFVMDSGADGLKAKREENKAMDSCESKDKNWSFDGDWKAQKLTEDDYMKAFNECDARYAKALAALLAQLRKGTD